MAITCNMLILLRILKETIVSKANTFIKKLMSVLLVYITRKKLHTINYIQEINNKEDK